MTIGERIRIVRETSESKKLSMAAFAERLGVTSGAISHWENENDGRKVSKAMISLICKEFGINETWLLTGEGEMRASQSKEQEVAETVVSIMKNNDAFRYKLIKLISQMDEHQMEMLKDLAIKLGESASEE